MKKIAFYVEGQTEQVFLEKLINEIAGKKNIQIELQKFQGHQRPSKTIIPKTLSCTQYPTHHVLIYDCAGERNVKSLILENIDSLFSKNYTQIIGLCDLYPKTMSDLSRFENDINHGTLKNGHLIGELPNGASIIIAVREIEDWFLKECSHFTRIDNRLTKEFILSHVAIDPCNDDLTKRTTSAADDLKSIYQLANKTYNKNLQTVQETVESLDYANLYLNIRQKIVQLDTLMTKIDSFLTAI